MSNSLPFILRNNTGSSAVYAYVTGLALQHGSRRCLLRSNGTDLYFPDSPPSVNSPLQQDCAIPLGAPGKETTIQVPQMAGGRVWISRNDKLVFLLNPGPSLVEPSVLNLSDPNANADFGFVEFTLNDSQLYANISYVDFVGRLPIGIELRTACGATTKVSGLPPGGIDKIANGLRQQASRDHQPWDRLIVANKTNGKPLRILNATHSKVVGADFGAYFDSYISQVWKKYADGSGCRMAIDTQSPAGILTGCINTAGELDFGQGLTFTRPNTADVLGCDSGLFTTGVDARRNALIPRLAAAFVRSTLLCETCHPSDPKNFYKDRVTHHYCRIVHEVNSDGKGYAFAYDDVDPTGGVDQSGKVNAGDPTAFIITLGGAK